ncbi:trypsin-like serine protease [Rubellicoccus peritrichatus]|uniref:Trypsin-like serine protease n=1 Tax=Rubellicoccus peritrichatus TaxID=3080537 RepID=A0AAQ3LEC6_9BACT|nr:trypsin-like serine protease [Puniceicoccus sp. CR14]WOO42058.1 trypsin-like serine protease [Puniceicoccus sp. CR14]
MRILLTLPFALSITLGTVLTHGSSIRDDVPDATYQALANNEGEYAAGFRYPDFAGVAMVENISENTHGSGALIHPRWILTAAHVIKEDPAENPEAGHFVVRFGAGGGNFDRTIQVEKIIMHPAWIKALDGSIVEEQLFRQGVDIALVKLSEAVNDVPLSSININQSETLSGLLYTSGYGVYGTGTQGRLENDEIKRSVQNNADRILSSIEVTIPGYESLRGGQIALDFDNPDRMANTLNGFIEAPGPDGIDVRYLGDGSSLSIPQALEGTPTGGDSGGPWLMRFGREWKVVGVESYGNQEDEVYGDISIATRVANFAGWILPMIWEDKLGQTFDATNGWAWKQNAGLFYVGSPSWLYHETGGWIFPTTGIESGMWFYGNNTGSWHWTQQDFLPWAFQQSTGQWGVFFSFTE